MMAQIWTSYDHYWRQLVANISIRARAVSLPISSPTRISTRVISQRHFIIVDVSVQGIRETGIGYAYVGTLGGEVVANFTNTVLSPLVADLDPNDIVGIWEVMLQETLLIGRRGVALRAISAVDMALWDLAAKKVGLPLAVMLGGTIKPIPAYASGGYYRPEQGDWNDAVRNEINSNRSYGFTDHKIKVGGLSIKDDATRVATAIETISGSGRLAIDANNAYASVADATRAARAFEEATAGEGLWWFEEPLAVEDVKGLAQVRRNIHTPVATGEISQTRYEFRALIEDYATDILQPDVGVIGGVTEYMRVIRTAETFGVPTAPHWHANVHAHLAAASSGCLVIEHFDLDKDIYNFERLVTPETRLKVEGGFCLLSDLPGLGFILDEEAISVFEIAG
jgi:L-alanine-DL-glutamate epimerase-like enolase superfamily enzyme